MNQEPIELQKIWWKQIPSEFCSLVGSRLREISFRFGDSKIIQKILPTQFSIEASFPEPSEVIEGKILFLATSKIIFLFTFYLVISDDLYCLIYTCL